MSKTKKLFIVRHAKSRWSQTDLIDHDRPLNERGFREAVFMAKRMSENTAIPEYWVTSTALRTKTTANTFLEAFDQEQPLNLDKRIYQASHASLLPLINEFPQEAESAVLFGHNPSLSYLASGLTNANIAMQTCCVIELELMVNAWTEVATGSGMLQRLDFPRTKKSSEL